MSQITLGTVDASFYKYTSLKNHTISAGDPKNLLLCSHLVPGSYKSAVLFNSENTLAPLPNFLSVLLAQLWFPQFPWVATYQGFPTEKGHLRGVGHTSACGVSL